MKLMIKVDTEKDNPEELTALIKHLFTKNNPVVQTQLTNDKKDADGKERKYFCNNPECKKEIEKSVVAFCLHPDNKDRFKGKVYCRECQEGK